MEKLENHPKAWRVKLVMTLLAKRTMMDTMVSIIDGGIKALHIEAVENSIHLYLGDILLRKFEYNGNTEQGYLRCYFEKIEKIKLSKGVTEFLCCFIGDT